MVYRVLPQHPEVELKVYQTRDPQSREAIQRWNVRYVPRWVLLDANGDVLVEEGSGMAGAQLGQVLAQHGL